MICLHRCEFPHVTIYGYVNFELQIIRNAIKKSIEGLESFTVLRSDLKYSDNIWKTVYFDLKPHPILSMIHKKLENYFGKNQKFSFSPHFSLIYKIMNDFEKQQIINELTLKNEFVIDRIAIMKFSHDIEKWKIIESLPFFP